MREVSLEKAKEIIVDRSYNSVLKGYGKSEQAAESRALQLLRFTRLAMEAEICTVQELDDVCRGSHDLVHLSGVHKFKYDTHSHKRNIDELRCMWGIQWEQFRHIPHMQNYIETVCENAGGKERSGHIGLFFRSNRKPWRTPERIAARHITPQRLLPLTEFCPYIARDYASEHAILLQIDTLVPKGLPAYMRADICQDMLVDVISGKWAVDGLRGALNFYMRQFFKNNTIYKSVSIDAPIFGDNRKKTLDEVLADPQQMTPEQWFLSYDEICERLQKERGLSRREALAVIEKARGDVSLISYKPYLA